MPSKPGRFEVCCLTNEGAGSGINKYLIDTLGFGVDDGDDYQAAEDAGAAAASAER